MTTITLSRCQPLLREGRQSHASHAHHRGGCRAHHAQGSTPYQPRSNHILTTETRVAKLQIWSEASQIRLLRPLATSPHYNTTTETAAVTEERPPSYRSKAEIRGLKSASQPRRPGG
jgi:hypothetical protein